MMDDADLPEPYSRYFALRTQGVESEEIAKLLDIPGDAFDAFVAVAHAKLARGEGDALPQEGDSTTMA